MIRVNKVLIDPAILEQMDEMKATLTGLQTQLAAINEELKKPVSIIIPDTLTEEERAAIAKSQLPNGGIIIIRSEDGTDAIA